MNNTIEAVEAAIAQIDHEIGERCEDLSNFDDAMARMRMHLVNTGNALDAKRSDLEDDRLELQGHDMWVHDIRDATVHSFDEWMTSGGCVRWGWDEDDCWVSYPIGIPDSDCPHWLLFTSRSGARALDPAQLWRHENFHKRFKCHCGCVGSSEWNTIPEQTPSTGS